MTLVCFRMFFGALMASEAFHKYYDDIPRYFACGEFHFTYPLLDWVVPWPSFGMKIIVIIMGLAAIGVMLGFYYRYCASEEDLVPPRRVPAFHLQRGRAAGATTNDPQLLPRAASVDEYSACGRRQESL